MEPTSVIDLAQDMVKVSLNLLQKYKIKNEITLNYVCFFTHSQVEYEILISSLSKIGKIVQYTHSGPMFRVRTFQTLFGKIKFLKVRDYDKTRLERGYVDFSIADYWFFKKECISKSGFRFINRSDMEMIELLDPSFDVRAYFSLYYDQVG